MFGSGSDPSVDMVTIALCAFTLIISAIFGSIAFHRINEHKDDKAQTWEIVGNLCTISLILAFICWFWCIPYSRAAFPHDASRQIFLQVLAVDCLTLGLWMGMAGGAAVWSNCQWRRKRRGHLRLLE